MECLLERGCTVLILKSVPIIRSTEAEREKQLIDFIQSYVKQYMRPENPSPVLLYGDNTSESLFHCQWLAGRLERIQKERKSVSCYVPQTVSVEEPGFDYFEHFCLTIADSAKEIWIVELVRTTSCIIMQGVL